MITLACPDRRAAACCARTAKFISTTSSSPYAIFVGESKGGEKPGTPGQSRTEARSVESNEALIRTWANFPANRTD